MQHQRYTLPYGEMLSPQRGGAGISAKFIERSRKLSADKLGMII